MARVADPLTGLAADLETQRRYVAEQVPVYARMLELLPGVITGARRERLVTAWASREFDAFYERPLLLLAALRDEALLEGSSHPLWKAIAADEPSADDLTRSALEAALDRDRVWELLAQRYVQTNETSRAVAWLWPAALIARERPGREVALFDIGASAGLNLVADRLPPIWEDGQGRPLAVSPLAPIASRRGFDARPLDALDPDTERWLRACVWPGQHERLTRLDQSAAALLELAATGGAPVIDELSAAEVPGELPRGNDEILLAYQTVVRDYLAADERLAYEAGMLGWLAESEQGRAAWIQLELEGGVDVPKPFAITARIGGASDDPIELARCDPHPRELIVDGGQVARFVKAMA